MAPWTVDRKLIRLGAAPGLRKAFRRAPVVIVVGRIGLGGALQHSQEVKLEVIGIEQDSTGVTVTARPHDGGETSQWRASYVVAADGAHSTVRDLLHVPYPGKQVLSSVVLADVKLSDGPITGG